MALFQFRRSRDEQAAAKLPPAPTVEAIRRRAMHRLVGAAVLVLAGVIGFPLVFDSQPRPIPVDLPIDIADKNKVKPLVAPPPVEAAPASLSTLPPLAMAKPPAPGPEPPVVVAARSAAVTPHMQPPAPTPAPSVVKAPEPVPAPPATKTADASKAQALLEGKDVSRTAPAAASGDARFVVQVGAFSEPEKAREVRQKVEGAGLKTYTQVVETKDGSRTRVRVGPFPDKDQAQKAADRIRKLDFSPAILTL